MVPVVPLFVT